MQKQINPKDHVPPEDPNILNLIVSHYDCEKQHNLRQFSLLMYNNVNKLLQIYNIQNTSNVYVRAKAKRIAAFKCEAYVKTHKQWCSRQSTKHRTDRMDWYTNSLELQKIIDPIECKN